MSQTDPSILIQADAVDAVGVLMLIVREAVQAELDRREIKPGSFAAIHCEVDAESPSKVGIVFTVELRDPDMAEITFKGVR